jgi:LysM repeat protein
MEQPVKAQIQVKWQGKPKPDLIPVQFNPTELSFSKAAQLAEISSPGLDSPIIQFVRGQSETLTLDLFFDTTEDGMGAKVTSVTKLTDKIYELMKIEPERHAPPICTFIWNNQFPGNLVTHGSQRRPSFQCVVESVRQRFTLFSPLGVPLRATLTVSLREYKTLDQQLKQLKLNSPDKTQNHVVQAGDTLSGIAGQHYLKPGEWRRIAGHNEIEDPRRIRVGTFVEVPPIT